MPRSPATGRSPRTDFLRTLALRLALHALLALPGLTAVLAPSPAIAQRAAQQPQQQQEEEQAMISQAELHALTNGFADRYMTYIVTAAEQIERDNANAQHRRLAHRIKLVQISAVYDIVTNPDPFTQLLDLTLVVSLQARKWIDDDMAEKWFGTRGKHLVSAMRQARSDIWKIASRVMRTSQLEQLDTLILQWHRKHPDIELVSYVRFDDFAASRTCQLSRNGMRLPR